MRFLYKIYSGYDGFTPKRIPDRLRPGRILQLGWQRYLEAINIGDEVWVYFHGPHRFTRGVYAKGFIRTINLDKNHVLMRVREYETSYPLTDQEISTRIAAVVAPRFRQVFLFPDEWSTVPNCSFSTSADTCRDRMCDSCEHWESLPRIAENAVGWPARLRHTPCRAFYPAYWVVPSRCYLYRKGSVNDAVIHTTNMFIRFKIGEEALAYPLAFAIYERLRQARQLDFDCIVPVPLSPEKEELKEIHRTRLLSREVGRLLGVDVRELLQLRHAISKRKLRLHRGFTAQQFEDAYLAALEVDPKTAEYRRILLIDDVSTEGSTLHCASMAIRSIAPRAQIFAATAGQMIVKAVVLDESGMLD